MALPLPKGQPFTMSYRMLPADFEMPSMEVASDHYSMGFIIHGDRKVITPTMTYSIHQGYVNAMPPFLYHRTIPASSEFYESYLLKFSPEFIRDFISETGQQYFDQIFNVHPKHFEKDDEKEIFYLAELLLSAFHKYEEADIYEARHTALFRIKNMLYSLLMEIHDRGIPDTEKSTIHNTELTGPIMDAVYYMEKNYQKDLKIEDIAAVSGYSVSYFSRLFASQLGTPFSEYLCITRLKHVQDMLLTSDLSVMDISLECGFSYPGNMAASFKKEFGMTPLQFRKQNQKGKK